MADWLMDSPGATSTGAVAQPEGKKPPPCEIALHLEGDGLLGVVRSCNDSGLVARTQLNLPHVQDGHILARGNLWIPADIRDLFDRFRAAGETKDDPER